MLDCPGVFVGFLMCSVNLSCQSTRSTVMYTVCLVNLSSHAVRDPSYVRAVRTAVRYFVFWAVEGGEVEGRAYWVW